MIIYPYSNVLECICSRMALSQINSTSKRGRYCFDTLRPRQSSRHFIHDIFQWISIKISLKFVPKGSIQNFPASVLIMDWCRPLPEQATGHCPNQWSLIYWRIYALLGLNELMLAWRFSCSTIGYNQLLFITNTVLIDQFENVCLVNITCDLF